MPVNAKDKAKEIFSSASALPFHERSSFLDEQCGNDDALRRSIESMLDSFEKVGSGPDISMTPTLKYTGSGPERKLRVGETVGRYKILELLGSGGMGEVYLGEDPKLGRRVAVKFLREEFSRERDPLQRFVREAKSASALNHPNIITIYEIGEWRGGDYIAMEFVQGKSLRHLISDGKITLKNAVNVAVQVASALGAAHNAGIIHRDIKPENIMLRPDGIAKVLDFGLAKFTSTPADGDIVSNEATTRGGNSTIPGIIMGTITYMSPEQARGKATDSRTDIWSLGVVLYEMVAGRAPFTGETKSDLLVSILKSEPEPIEIPPSELGDGIRKVIAKCLEKDVDRRYQSTGELILDLKMLQSGAIADTAGIGAHGLITGGGVRADTHKTVPFSTEAHERKPSRAWMAVPAVLIALAAIGTFVWQRQSRTAVASPYSTYVPEQVTSWKNGIGERDSSRPRISPDGRIIAYVALERGATSIWLKQLAGGEPFTQKHGDSIDTSPVWSPDGDRIAFVSDRGGRRGIWTAPALGGVPTMLTPIDTMAYLVHWSRDDSALYFRMGQNLHKLDIASGAVSKLTNFEETPLVDRGFSVSPDEKRIVYADYKGNQSDLFTADIDGSNLVQLTNDSARDSGPVWFPDGKHVVYNSDRNGVSQIVMASTEGLSPVQLTLGDNDVSLSDVSPDGRTILYTTAKDDSDIWAIDLTGGSEFQLTADIGAEFWPAVSPRGDAVVYQASKRMSVGSRLRESTIFGRPIASDAKSSELSPTGFGPIWSPDGSLVAFFTPEKDTNSISVMSAAGGDARKVTTDGVMFGGYSLLPYNRLQTQDLQWSADGNSLIYSARRDGKFNIWSVSKDGGDERMLTANEDASLVFVNPAVSADGSKIAWVAFDFSSPAKRTWSVWVAENGRQRQVYRSESSLRLIGWSASGDGLIVKAVERVKDSSPQPLEVDVFEIYLDGEPPREIAALKDCYFANIALSPDRGTLAFVIRDQDRDSIQVLPLATRSLRTVAVSNDPRVYFSGLTFSPDGQTVFYGKQANWQVISMMKGVN